MARPLKNGLDYFPLDVNIETDDKMELIEAQHGIVGYGVIIKLFCKIYANGYFYDWGEKERLLASKRFGVDSELIDRIVKDASKWSLFDSEKLNRYQILTSKGIQKRYFEAVMRRGSVEVDEIYLCLNAKELENYKNVTVNVDNNRVNVDINTHSAVVNDNIGTQSKEEKSREENNTETDTKETGKYTEMFLTIWGRYPRKDNKSGAFNRYRTLAKKHSEVKVNEVIENYIREVEQKKTESRYIKKLNNFLNDSFDDYFDVVVAIPKNRNKFITYQNDDFKELGGTHES